MAVIPMLLNFTEDLANSFYGHDDFGFGIYPHEICRRDYRPSRRIISLPALRNRKYPYSLQGRRNRNSHVGKDGFQVSVDVQNFKPNEIKVKTVGNSVVIECKHEEREDDHGVITRQFTRKFTIPKGYDPKDVISTLSSDGVLTVKAPLPPADQTNSKERIVHIQQTGPACDSIKDIRSVENSNVAMNGTTDNADNIVE